MSKLKAATATLAAALLAVLGANPAAAATVPGALNSCTNSFLTMQAKDVYAYADGKTATANVASLSSNAMTDYKVVVTMYDAAGNRLWNVDTTTWTTAGKKTWTLDHAVPPGKGRILSFKFTAIITLEADRSCTAKDKV
jgi:hypothetical protein